MRQEKLFWGRLEFKHDQANGGDLVLGLYYSRATPMVEVYWVAVCENLAPSMGGMVELNHVQPRDRKKRGDCFLHASSLPPEAVKNLRRLSGCNLSDEAAVAIEKLLGTHDYSFRPTTPPVSPVSLDLETLQAAALLLRPSSKGCELCKVNPTSQGQLEAHFCGAKHINCCRVQRNQRGTIRRADTGYSCKKCKMHLDDLLGAHTHICAK